MCTKASSLARSHLLAVFCLGLSRSSFVEIHAWSPYMPQTTSRQAHKTAFRISQLHQQQQSDDEGSYFRGRNVTAVVDKKIRVAKAQAEIDRILRGPEAPFDMETELKKVASIAPPVMQTPEDEESESIAAEREEDLYQAAKEQDYGKAAQIQQEMSQQHIDDCGVVLQVNAAFYRAFSDKDIRSMEALWLKDGTATCIHPSAKPLVGSKSVLNSWRRMFESSSGSFQRNWMEPHEIRLTIKGACTAIVTCDEHVYARRFVRGKKRQTELLNKLTATNIFRKVAGKWYLTYHHASWHADSEAAKIALRGGVGSSSKSRTVVKPGRRSSGNSEEASADIGMDGILGVNKFGPLLGSSDGDQDKKPVKRIVMGSLSDIFSSDLFDMDNDENESGSIIRFSQQMGQDEDDEDDDEDLDVIAEEEEEEDDEEKSDGEVSVAWASAESSKNGRSTSTAGSAASKENAVRQSCISTLRKLCRQGSISPQHKRVLLTDIISCSSKGEYSMVEVAYELLCGEEEDKESAEEEFADQCRVFALSLPESPVSTDI